MHLFYYLNFQSLNFRLQLEGGLKVLELGTRKKAFRTGEGLKNFLTGMRSSNFVGDIFIGVVSTSLHVINMCWSVVNLPSFVVNWILLKYFKIFLKILSKVFKWRHSFSGDIFFFIKLTGNHMKPYKSGFMISGKTNWLKFT